MVMIPKITIIDFKIVLITHYLFALKIAVNSLTICIKLYCNFFSNQVRQFRENLFLVVIWNVIPGELPNFPVISSMNVAKCGGCFALAYFADC